VYRNYTKIPFPIFTDPTRQLHKILKMGWSLNTGVLNTAAVEIAIEWQRQLATVKANHGSLSRKGGQLWWLGGEFLFRDGRIIWAHRMKNYQGHVEMDVLKKLLNLEE
jgi:hypothetical protein